MKKINKNDFLLMGIIIVIILIIMIVIIIPKESTNQKTSNEILSTQTNEDKPITKNEYEYDIPNYNEQGSLGTTNEEVSSQ